jgi:N-acyl-D-aspartate/D-glutamate deacylase
MKIEFLIRNGTVVDGTGAPAYRADVRIRDGRIAEIGEGLQQQKGERVFDAAGCYVTPGTIENHNHWDGAMWWSPMMEPLASYGVTTSVNGNCGFSMAPLSDEHDIRPEIIDIFNYFEDVPMAPMHSAVTWDWRSWSEYKASVQRHVRTQVNIASYCGHIPMRLAVMGLEAWDRAATPDEVARMCELLDDALAAGALGMSSNLLDYDRHERPLPSYKADDDEWRALIRVLARYPGVTLQLPIDNFMRKTAGASAQRIAALVKEVAPSLRVQLAGFRPGLDFQSPWVPEQEELNEKFKAEGLDIWAGYHHVGPTLHVNFAQSLLFAQQGNYVWQEIVNETDIDKKMDMLADPEWRARARDSWDNQHSHTMLNDPSVLLLRESQTGAGPTGISLSQYMHQKGINHPSDAMAEWALANGPESNVQMPEWPNNEELLMKLYREPNTIGNLSDAGAHTTLFCGAGDNVLLLTQWVRDRRMLTIEEAIHVLTGKAAKHFGFEDRGTIELGKRADIAVFALDEIARRPEAKVWDVPDGMGGRTYRYTRQAAPMRLTLCNGVATFDNGEITGNFPGEFIGPQAPEPFAMAAE